jgi:hypothetical protein
MRQLARGIIATSYAFAANPQTCSYPLIALSFHPLLLTFFMRVP